MIKIINSGIVDPLARQEWTSAAGKWRLPFWDWALPQADTGDFGVPGLVLASEVNIYKLGKREEEPVLNPLHKFTNKLKEGGILKKVPMGDSRLGKYAIKLEKVSYFKLSLRINDNHLV
jgi:tyrosinase